jgi:two-component system, OmpR family, sensor histidine kinase BaeS
MLKNLWTKFLLLLVTISVIALSAAFILREFMIHDFSKYLEGEMEDRIYWVIADLESTYEKNSGWKEDAILEDTIWALMLGLEIRIKDADDNILMDTTKAVNSLSPLVKKRLNAVSQYRSPQTDNLFQPYPLFLAGKEIGSLEVQFLSPRKESIFIARSNTFLLISLLIVGAVAVLLSFLFSRKLTSPIKKLASATEALMEGNLKMRAAISGSDEIGRLSETFNKMAQKLESQESLRRKLISNVAHELRTPLGAMRSEMEGMMDDIIPVDKKQIQSLYEETGRLKHILEGIEDLAQAEASSMSMEKQPIELRPFLNYIVERFKKLFMDKGVSTEFECPDSIAINADPDKLSQVVINLLSNALQATEKGGTVRIKAGQKTDGIFIEVHDTGIGIKQEDLPFIFERFYKVSEGGLGLGLTIVKELVETHRGTIDVSSEYGKGSAFTVYIPYKTVHNSS